MHRQIDDKTVYKATWQVSLSWRVASAFRLPGESCVLYLCSLVKKRKKIVPVSDGVSPKEAEKMGFSHACSVEVAMKTVMMQKANLYLMPKGSITLPIKGQ